ncbi:MAG: hypothetical protein P8H38_08430 [Flavobacteriaceae bacterium]|jgi:uncharacterized membrane protein|nr:hypothetical protein [Flavobacteriaceae bacterium]
MKKQPNKWLIFSSLAFQIAIIMFAAVKLGAYLDTKYNLSNKFASLLLSGFGLVTILWLIYQQSKNFWDKE